MNSTVYDYRVNTLLNIIGQDCRRRQKHIFRQLCVVDDMVKLLAGLESVDQLLNEPSPQNPGNAHRLSSISAEHHSVHNTNVRGLKARICYKWLWLKCCMYTRECAMKSLIIIMYLLQNCALVM